MIKEQLITLHGSTNILKDSLSLQDMATLAIYILPLSAATPLNPAFSLVESRGISGMLSTCPESRLFVFKYSVFITFQISNTEERGQTAFITPLLSCSVPGNICNRGYRGIVSKIQNCVDQ